MPNVFDFSFECDACHRVTGLPNPNDAKCPMGGSTNGRKVTDKERNKAYEAGVYFDLPPGSETPKRPKP
jgi:hypothetical protein